MTTHRASRLAPRTFRVHLDAHEVGRWSIPANRVEIPAASAEHARLIAVRTVHAARGLPPWLPLVRTSLKFARNV
jgi:hypothetical protein